MRKESKRLTRSLYRSDIKAAWWSIIPVIAIILVIRGYPLITALVESFFRWDGLSKNYFVGFSNYGTLFQSEEFWGTFKNTLVYMLYIPLQLFVGIVVAVLLYEKVAGWRIFRSVYYVPSILSPVIIALMFKVFFGLNGPVNTVIESVGGAGINWLNGGATASIVIIICLVWTNIGWQSLLIMGGMASIPPSVLEAAKIDGAGYWKRLFKVTIPMLARTIEYSLIVSAIWVFTGLFPFIHSLTFGGPGYETSTVDYLIYLKAFVTGTRLGQACALSIILLVLVIIITILQMKMTDKIDDWSE